MTGKIAIAILVSLVAVVAACGDDDPPPPGSSGTTSGGNPTGVGNHCTKNEDCATNNCYVGPGGGYCTTTCSDEGSTSQCPLDTVCKPIQGGARRCLLICGSLSTCRTDGGCPAQFCPSGSSCVSVSETDHKACEPNPG